MAPSASNPLFWFSRAIRHVERENRVRLSLPAAWMVCCAAAFAGLALLPVWASALRLWNGDALRSIGGFFPLLAFAGTIAAWRRMGWRNDGTWWGLPVALTAMAVATISSSGPLMTYIFRQQVQLAHPGVALFLYGAGATLLFGGPRLLRAALAPLCLLLLIDPVPRAFQRMVDMPLQILSADTARGFAHLIGLEPTGDQLRMMFAPSFGMMIVPGCDGLRGAVTLGYLALIYGYIRRASPRALAAMTVGGVLLGYLLNLLRLCVLVCYYRLGVAIPSIRSYGVQVDYAIGVTLFLAATILIGWTAGHYFARDDAPESVIAPEDKAAHRPLLPRVAVLAVCALGFFVPQAHSLAKHSQPVLTAENVAAAFPATVGRYTLAQRWQEIDADDQVRFVWGRYERRDGGAAISMGVYLGGEGHLVALSKLMQGIRPQWNGALDAAGADGVPMRFVTSFYRDGAMRTMDAETSCGGEVCELQGGVEAQGPFTFVRPRLADLILEPAAPGLPLVLRQEWTADDADADSRLREQFAAAVREFSASLDLKPLLKLERP